jgi:hypothetical protein
LGVKSLAASKGKERPVAQTIVIPGTVEEAKIRLPVAVWLLGYPTLGIYGYFWWYYINNEMRNLGKSKGTDSLGTSPVASLFAYIFSFLIIPGIWTIVTTTRRVGRAQRMYGIDPISGWVAALLLIFTFGIGYVIYMQSQLNKVWRAISTGQAGAATTVEGPKFDPITGQPITGYDPQTGQPILGDRAEPSAESPVEPPAQASDEPTGQDDPT